MSSEEEKPKKKKKIDHTIIDGKWVEEDRRIKGAIRKVFALSPQMKECIDKNRIVRPYIKKDGQTSKVPRVFYECAMCKSLTQTKHIEVDHIEPVIPLWRDGSDIDYVEYTRRVFCEVENLQILCSTPIKILGKGNLSCHKKKSREENYLRSQWKKFWEEKNIKNDQEKRDFLLNNPSILEENTLSFKHEYEKSLQEKNNKKKKKVKKR